MNDTIIEQTTAKKTSDKSLIYTIVMIAAVLLVLGAMLGFHLAAENAANTVKELKEQHIAQLQAKAASGQLTGVWDGELSRQIKAADEQCRSMQTARNLTGIYGGIGTVLLIIALQTIANKKDTAVHKSSASEETDVAADVAE